MANTLISTTLPSGIRWKNSAGGVSQPILRIALLFSPRLDLGADAAGTLGDARFKDFLKWPEKLTAASYILRGRKDFNPATGESDEIAVAISPLTDAAKSADVRFWQTIFPSSTVVRPYDKPTAAAAPADTKSYDAAQLDDAIATGYVAQLRSSRSFIGSPPEEPRENPLIRAVATGLQQRAGVTIAAVNPEQAAIATAFGRFASFHGRAAPGLVGAAALPPPNQPPDFHELLSALQDHSALMRKLGLVVSFEVPLTPAQLDAIGSKGRVRIEVNGLDVPSAVGFAPWTACELTPRVGSSVYGIFHPAKKDEGSPDGSGFRSLNETTARATSHELDAIANKVVGLALHVNESEQAVLDYSARPESPQHFPALRQGGMAIIDLPNAKANLAEADKLPVEQDIFDAEMRHRALEARLRTATTTAAGGVHALAADSDILYLEDGLVRGYRVDVRDVSKSSWRSLCARIPSYRFTAAPLKGSPFEHWSPGEDEGEVTKVVSYQEDLENPRRVSPYLAIWDGWSLVVPRPGRPVDKDGNPATPAAGGIQNLEFTPRVPSKSLEKKRFGQTYRLRMRTVDLAGDSWTLDEATSLIAAGLTVGVLEKKNLRLEPVRAPAIVEDGKGLEGEKGDVLVVRQLDNRDPRPSIRYVFPPDSPELLVEEQGVFDQMTDEQVYKVFKATEGLLKADKDGSLAAFRQGSGRMRVPYLPDPLSKSVIIKDVPLGSGSTGEVEFPSQSSASKASKSLLLESITLRLVPGNVAPSGVARTKPGEITVTLPPGQRVSARLCTSLPNEKVDTLWTSDAQAHLSQLNKRLGLSLKAAFNATSFAAEARRLVAAGEEPSVTPDRQVTFVYATQRPVMAPKFGDHPVVARQLNQVTAELVDKEFSLHVPSTGRIEFTASWTDIVDEPGGPEREIKSSLAPFGYNLSEDDKPSLGQPGIPESYWREDPDAGATLVKQKRREETKRRQSPTNHAFKDTKYREVVYIARAISRFGAFMPKSIKDDVDAQSKSVKSKGLVVLNTAPPDVPVVRHILPTFRSEQSGRSDRKHVGGGLRIYLERPWFSAGRGEKLAIVLYPADLTATPPELSRFVTEWGFNPRKLGGATSIRPALEDFRGDHERIVARTLTLYSGEKADPDLGGTVPPPITASVSIATYDVHLDLARDVRYCDIEVDPGRAYFPCLRLALARYQAQSLDAVTLSPVVLADIIQLTPDRTVSISRAATGKHKVAVTGVSYIDVEFGLGTSVIELVVQRRRAAPARQQPIWEIVSAAPITLKSERIGSETMVWSGEVEAPRDGDWRIVLVEYEFYSVDENARIRPGEQEMRIDGKRVARKQTFSDMIEIQRSS
jgi:hypothetical protein